MQRTQGERGCCRTFWKGSPTRGSADPTREVAQVYGSYRQPMCSPRTGTHALGGDRACLEPSPAEFAVAAEELGSLLFYAAEAVGLSLATLFKDPCDC